MLRNYARMAYSAALLPLAAVYHVNEMQEQEAACFFWLLFGSKKKKKTHKHKHNGDGGGSVDLSSGGKKTKLDQLRGPDRGPLATSATGSKKRRVIVSEDDMQNIIHLVNELVDLDYFDEDSEERIFDDCIRRIVLCIEEIMPEDFHLLVNSKHPLGGGLSPEHAHTIEVRAITYVRGLVCFPYLDRTDETRIIQFVVKILCQAMREDRSLALLNDKEQAGELIVDVLMKGAIAKIFDADEREKMVEEVLMTWCKIMPFLPASTLEWAAHKMITWCAKHIETALQTSFEEHNARTSLAMEAQRVTGAMLTGEVGREAGSGSGAVAVVKMTKPSGAEETVEDADHIEAMTYKHCLVEHLSSNLLEDLDTVPLPDFKKREWCNKLSNYIVQYSCDFEKLESIFHYLHQ